MESRHNATCLCHEVERDTKMEMVGGTQQKRCSQSLSYPQTAYAHACKGHVNVTPAMSQTYGATENEIEEREEQEAYMVSGSKSKA